MKKAKFKVYPDMNPKLKVEDTVEFREVCFEILNALGYERVDVLKPEFLTYLTVPILIGFLNQVTRLWLLYPDSRTFKNLYEEEETECIFVISIYSEDEEILIQGESMQEVLLRTLYKLRYQ